MKISQIISSGGTGQDAADPGSAALRAVSAAPAGQEEIVWPESAELTYGYVLGEAVLHFAEGASGGPIGLVQEGDLIEIDIPNHTINLCVDEDELARRRKDWVCPEPRIKTGYLARYARSVSSADKGAILL